MAEFCMPSLGADMDAGTLVEWKVKPGDRVARGDLVAVVDTNKGAIDIEIWEDGVVEEIRVGAGTKVPVGTVLAVVRGAREAGAAPPVRAAEALPAAIAPSAPQAGPGPPAVALAPAAGGAPPARTRASPAARARARALGVELSAATGTGPGGAVTVADVEAAARASAAPPRPPAPPPPPGPPGSGAGAIRLAIAAAMARSKREIPHYYLGTEIELSTAMSWLARENEQRSVPDRLLPVALLLKAVALAVHEVPEMNGYFVDGAFRPSEAVHLGVAISLRRGGLIAPALHDVDRRSLGEIMAGMNDLVARARSGGLRSSELSDSTLTVTSLGDLGVTTVYGVIYPPQVALVGFGRVSIRPWADGDRLAARPVVTAALSGDHRVSDGLRGALFLSRIDKLLQHPEAL